MKQAVRAITLLLLTVSVGRAQPSTDPAVLRGDSTQTRKRLAEAKQKITDGKAADAADDIQRLLDESADDLITFNGREYRPARWVAHSYLAELPPDALKTYQDRIDQPAKKLFEQGKQARDPRPLWQLLDRYFVSRPADPALLLLGELLFERGEFRAAEAVWRRLLSDADADIVYPNSKADPALVRARIALAVIFQNDIARAKAEVEAFKRKHPDATGTLAGKTGPLLATLQAHLARPPQLAPDATAETAWPTYGGGPDRAGRVPGGITTAIPNRPDWAKDPEDDRPTNPEIERIQRPLAPPARQPFGHPVIVGGVVYVTDGTCVFSYDLRGSEKPRTYQPSGIAFTRSGRVQEPACALTAADGLLYARVGVSAVRAPETVGGKQRESALVCLSPKLVERWRLYPPEDEKTPTAWEGAPLVVGRRLWAVYAKFEGGRAVHIAACYDPADARSGQAPAKPAWITELCDGALPSSDRNRQELLTLAGRNLVFCSNDGAVVAVDAFTGRRAWGFRYPRTKKYPVSPIGDPSPAVAFGGRVYVAPADGERVYALDAETGAMVWESGPTEGARILGVSRGQLIVTVTGPLRGIRALNLDTGSYRDPGSWVQGGNNAPLSYGQGLVTDDLIIWPTRDGLLFLDPTTGRPLEGPRTGPVREPHRNFFGHIAYADGVLVVVTAGQVRGYVARSKQIEVRPDLPPRTKFDLTADRAEAEAVAGNLDRARATLAQLVSADLPAPLRAWAAARMLQLSPPATDIDRLPAGVWAACEPLLSEWVLPSDGVPVTLGALLGRHLGRATPPVRVPTRAAEKPLRPSELTSEADVDHAFKLPHAVNPLVPIPGGECAKRAFAGGARVVVAVPFDRTKPSEYAAADLFTHAADVGEWFVVAGPRAVAIYDTVREPVWVFRVPSEPMPDGLTRSRIRGPEEPPDLSSFVLVGSWLLARVGEHHLIALDLTVRRVAWVLNTSGRRALEPVQFPNTVRFGPHVAVCGKFLVVQLSDGRRWFVELLSGRPTILPALGDRTAQAAWPHSPISLSVNRLFVSDGPGLLRLLQLDGRVKWSFEVERDVGLTGEPLRARVWANTLLVAVRRNEGVEIERVNLADGKPVWTEPAFADTHGIDLASADTDADRVYVPAGTKLLALSLANGKSAWEAELPDARGPRGWVVRAGKSCVIVYPAEAIAEGSLEAVWARVRRSFEREPYVWRLPGLAATLYDALSSRAVPVLLFDPETGKRLARLDVPAKGPAVTAWFDADRAVIATGDRVVWLK